MSPPRRKRASRLTRKIEEQRRVATGFDTIGDIAILRPAETSTAEKRRLARAILEEVKAVRCVFEQSGGIEGDFRLRRLRHLAGEDRTLTVHRENGCSYKVDVAKCYFSPRLSTERLRISEEVAEGESVLNMFAGVGPFSVLIAKRKNAKVISCELNSFACNLHEENNRANKVERLVKVVNADAAQLPKLTRRKFDRILMPHPSQADKFMPAALCLARRGSTVHYYRHVLGTDEDDATRNLAEELGRLLPAGAKYQTRKVREVGPRWLEMAAEILLP